jgi:hypothetical protein
MPSQIFNLQAGSLLRYPIKVSKLLRDHPVIQLPGEPTIRLPVMVTVAPSIFPHGLTAGPGIRLYSHRISALEAFSPECQDAPE